jgi:D-sedoheptulose 7-phosphate isomerase
VATEAPEAALARCAEASKARLASLGDGIDALSARLDELLTWGAEMAAAASQGQRILALGNGGSSAQADHFVAELVGRFKADRPAIGAVNLHGSLTTVTALGNDLDFDQAASRSLRAHGRKGDVLLCLSTSGRSANVLAAAAAAREAGIRVYALTGDAESPLMSAAHRALAVEGDDVASVQELHLVALHVLCDAIDNLVGGRSPC